VFFDRCAVEDLKGGAPFYKKKPFINIKSQKDDKD